MVSRVVLNAHSNLGKRDAVRAFANVQNGVNYAQSAKNELLKLA